MQLFSSCRSIPRSCLYARTSKFDDVMLFVVLAMLFTGLIIM